MAFERCLRIQIAMKGEEEIRSVECRDNFKFFAQFWGTVCGILYGNYTLPELKDDWSLNRRSKPLFDKRDLGQTNEQQRHFNE